MGTDRCVFVYLHGHVKLSQTSQCFIHIFWSIQSESEVTQSCLTLCDPWTVAHQAPSSMGFSRQEYWSGLPFPSPGDLPDPGIEPRSPTLQADALTSAPPGKPGVYKVPLNSGVIRSHCSCKSHQCVSESESEVTQLCPTLWDPVDYGLPGSSIHGILQARILEWVAISFSRESSQPRDRIWVSCIAGKHFTL